MLKILIEGKGRGRKEVEMDGEDGRPWICPLCEKEGDRLWTKDGKSTFECHGGHRWMAATGQGQRGRGKSEKTKRLDRWVNVGKGNWRAKYGLLDSKAIRALAKANKLGEW